MRDELATLRRDVRVLKLYAGALTAVALLACVTAFRAGAPQDQVLRARGLIIVDDAGRERILIGAPIPAAHNRVRTDIARAMDTWGRRFPREYANWYRGYRHTMNGMLVLDERGFDRVAVGDSVPDPNIGRRIAPSTGVIINDAAGFERSGYGLLTVGGKDRMVLGLDDGRGEEGLTLSVMDSGRAAVTVHDGRNNAYLGTAPANDPLLGNATPFVGLLLRKGTAERRITPDQASQ